MSVCLSVWPICNLITRYQQQRTESWWYVLLSVLLDKMCCPSAVSGPSPNLQLILILRSRVRSARIIASPMVNKSSLKVNCNLFVLRLTWSTWAELNIEVFVGLIDSNILIHLEMWKTSDWERVIVGNSRGLLQPWELNLWSAEPSVNSYHRSLLSDCLSVPGLEIFSQH